MLSTVLQGIKSKMGLNQEEGAMKEPSNKERAMNSDAARKNNGFDLDDEFVLSAKIGTRKSLAGLRSGSIANALNYNNGHIDRKGNMLRGLMEYVYQMNTDSEHEMVELQRNAKGTLGVELEGGRGNPTIPGDPGIFVKSILYGSEADRKLRVGDRILSVNGVNVKKKCLKEVAQLICSVRGVLRLYVKKSSPRQQLVNNVYRAEAEELEKPVFSRRHIEELEDAFSLYDKKGQGAVKTTSVFSLIRCLGYNPTEAEVWVYMNELGITVNPKLTFHDFVKLMTLMVTQQDHEEELRSVFSVFDKNGNGFFPLKDLEESFYAVSEKMSKRDIRNILRLADPDNDGLVSVKELERLLEPAIRIY